MGRASDQSAPQRSAEEVTEMLPAIGQALADAARQSGNSPTDMQSNMWNQALHAR